MSSLGSDTICAIATSPGRGGVGIVRVSGPLCITIAQKMLGFTPTPRHAHFSDFLDSKGQVIDQGIALFFAAPNSFTGEDIFELQAHGGYFVLNSLLKELLAQGARLAAPGEFSERAFLNGKMDLLQAEAIADLIDASSEQASRSAMRTLQGQFSKLINQVVQEITAVRVNIEAAIDFSDEDIDFISDLKVAQALDTIIATTDAIAQQANQGSLLREGINVVIAGKPNAGKSSLLNALSGNDTAIVTDVPGTTRDILSEQINIDGMPVHIIDTAGLRKTQDVVELEGVKRAHRAIQQADQILLIIDSSQNTQTRQLIDQHIQLLELETASDNKITVVFNKCDLINKEPVITPAEQVNGDIVSDTLPLSPHKILSLSARTGKGMDELRQHLKDCIGFNASTEGAFLARERHLQSLSSARTLLLNAQSQLSIEAPVELIAEDLRLSQKYLGEITGEFTSDDLLGEIFSNFCVGK
ncbi:MAG: tRNA uridine-5-carboxymethylaminomethyl(34) synthesis GTPase MnmE [SAR86 cluster bacterium]|uniref:tRNA modification GTPase MnmE n=1 Tax=SAR86 cluster bacterium TaxID=2030880 RepID=A0A2A4MRZ1_9GAMM|nr:MAG: tRNA uridine-5-carboxymethylaminomethyl(34) synthesis GTPase MnmE [SAR86 cluster bacterium]